MVQDLNFADIEMPGQFQDGNEVVTDAIVRLESIGSDVVIVRRQGTAVRRLAFHGSNGKTRYFTLQCSQVYASGGGLCFCFSQSGLTSSKTPAWHTFLPPGSCISGGEWKSLALKSTFLVAV